ncbi:hypothetical protein LY78DRAFT_344141 [Colletotrichum sublineola]|nr:hypothetical protein LY78DRAFT_344141 [Colletotrichum sublineola]
MRTSVCCGYLQEVYASDVHRRLPCFHVVERNKFLPSHATPLLFDLFMAFVRSLYTASRAIRAAESALNRRYDTLWHSGAELLEMPSSSCDYRFSLGCTATLRASPHPLPGA